MPIGHALCTCSSDVVERSCKRHQKDLDKWLKIFTSAKNSPVLTVENRLACLGLTVALTRESTVKYELNMRCCRAVSFLLLILLAMQSTDLFFPFLSVNVFYTWLCTSPVAHYHLYTYTHKNRGGSSTHTHSVIHKNDVCVLFHTHRVPIKTETTSPAVGTLTMILAWEVHKIVVTPSKQNKHRTLKNHRN